MKYIILSLLFLISSQTVVAQTSDANFKKISKTILNNDYKSLGVYFANTLDLIIESNDGTYGKQQAMMMLKDFFEQNKISQFKIKHKGSSNEKTFYAVCNMSSQKKSWSVYILLNSQFKIIQLQIEN